MEKRFTLVVETVNGRKVLEGYREDYGLYGGYSHYRYYKYKSISGADAAVGLDVDLRSIIEDMSSDMIAYLKGAYKVLKVLREKDKATFGCTGGCGRTFTVLLLVLGALYGSRERVIEKYKAALEQVKEKCPETKNQFRIASAGIIGAEKVGRADFVNLNLWVKKWVLASFESIASEELFDKEGEVEELAAELMKIANSMKAQVAGVKKLEPDLEPAKKWPEEEELEEEELVSPWEDYYYDEWYYDRWRSWRGYY